jgi:hypothetical protein
MRLVDRTSGACGVPTARQARSPCARTGCILAMRAAVDAAEKGKHAAKRAETLALRPVAPRAAPSVSLGSSPPREPHRGFHLCLSYGEHVRRKCLACLAS